jgi:hypothetical protein
MKKTIFLLILLMVMSKAQTDPIYDDDSDS